MSSVKTKLTPEQSLAITTLKQEVIALEGEITSLEKENLNSFILFRMLRRWLPFTPFKEKLEWNIFKLKLKNKELLLSNIIRVA